MLCLLCFLIAVPFNVFAAGGLDSTSTDNSSISEQSAIPDTTQPADNSTGTVDDQPPAPDVTPAPDTAPAPEVTPTPDTGTGTVEQPPAPDTNKGAVDNQAPPTDQALAIEKATPDAAQLEAQLRAQSDNHDPKIATVTFSPENPKVGDTVKIAVKHDMGTTVNGTVIGAAARIWDPAKDLNESEAVSLRYDSENDEWIGFFVVKENWDPGYWRAEVEAHYNYTCVDGYYYADQYDNKKVANAFNVQNNGDYTPPQIVSVVANPTPVKAGQEVTFTATINDVNNQSSVVYADLLIYQDTDLYFDEEQYVVLTHVSGNIWEGKYMVPANLPDDSKIEYTILAYDKAGNIVEKDSGNKTRKSFKVVNKQEDAIELVSPSEGNYYTVSKGEPTIVKVKVNAKDIGDGVGVKNLEAVLYNEQTGQYYHFTELANVPDTNNWKGDIKLTYLDQHGYYDLYVTGEYTNGSKITYQYMTWFHLENPDYTYVSIDKINAQPKRPKAGDTINISAAVNFEDYVPTLQADAAAKKPDKKIAAVSAAVVYSSYQNEEDYFNLTFDTATGKWTAPYTLKVFDPQGFEVIIKAVDDAGNAYFDYETFLFDKTIIDQTPPSIDFAKFSTATINLGQRYHVETKVFDPSQVKFVKVVLAKRTDLTFYNPDWDNGGPVDLMSSKTQTPVDITKTDFYHNWNPFFDGKYASYSFDLAYDAAKELWVGDYTLPLNGATGLFVVNIITQDMVGNQTSSALNSLNGNSIQTVVILPAENVVPVTVTPTPVAAAAPVVTTSEGELPDTGTNNYNLLFAGFILLAIGGTSFVFRRRKEQ